jgi:hypothetical protein
MQVLGFIKRSKVAYTLDILKVRSTRISSLHKQWHSFQTHPHSHQHFSSPLSTSTYPHSTLHNPKGLRDAKMVALTRYVRADNAAPRLGILAPDLEGAYCTWTAIPFADQYHIHRFPVMHHASDVSEEVLEERRGLMDTFIESMFLDDDEDANLNPAMQRLFECITTRAVYPDEEVEDIHEKHARTLVPDPSIVESSQATVDVLKAAFKLTVVDYIS